MTKDELIEELGEAFRASQNRTQLFDEMAAKRLGVNLTDLRCLDIVDRLGRPTAGALAAEMGLTSGAITALLDRMVSAGYLRRVRDETDRRRIHIELTEQATREMLTIWGPLKEAYDAMMHRYTNEQLRFILDFMRSGEEIGWGLVEQLRAAD
jgi:DNA-binding MarR family transcriptional regulator